MMLAGQDTRTVLVSVLHGRPVAASMLPVLEELGGLGLVALVRPTPAGFEVMLTTDGELENRRTTSIPERLALSARARRARARATEAFERFTGGARDAV